jgi:hypothetical protein
VKPQLRVVPSSRLVLDEKNANKGTMRGRELLEESLGKYGAGRSAVVDRNNRVIAGNKTVEAAVASGMKSISVIQTDGSSLVAVQRNDLDLKRDKKARELAIADNRVGEIDLEWNTEVLASLEANAAIYVWHASQRQIEVEKAMRDCGILVYQQIIWVKNKPVLTHSFYMWP